MLSEKVAAPLRICVKVLQCESKNGQDPKVPFHDCLGVCCNCTLPFAVSPALQTAPLVTYEYKALQHTLYVKVRRVRGREGEKEGGRQEEEAGGFVNSWSLQCTVSLHLQLC